MLDFTAPRLQPQQMRCQRRAHLARRSARLCQFLLAGLVGCALVIEPSLVTATRGGMASLMARIPVEARVLTEARLSLPATVPILRLPLGEADEGGTVAQADTTILRP